MLEFPVSIGCCLWWDGASRSNKIIFVYKRFKTFPFDNIYNLQTEKGNHYWLTTNRNWILFWPQIFIYSEPFKMSSSGLLFLELRIYCMHELKKKTKNFFDDNPFAADYRNSCFLKQRLLNLYIIISSFLAINYFVLKAPCPQEFNRVWKAFFFHSSGFICYWSRLKIFPQVGLDVFLPNLCLIPNFYSLLVKQIFEYSLFPLILENF